jgi:hypothetical protein
MGDDWDRSWDRSKVTTLTGPLKPPDFTWRGEDDSLDLDERKKRIREESDRMVRVLDGGDGYETLLTMKDRLEDALAEAEESRKRLQSRVKYTRLLAIEVEEAFRSILEDRELPQDELWSTKVGKSLPEAAFAGKSVSEEHSGNIIAQDWNIGTGIVTIDPPSGRYDIDFEKDLLYEVDRRSYGLDQTWEELHSGLVDDLESLKEVHKRMRNTVRFIEFRRDAAKKILHYFDLFGTTDGITTPELPDIFEGWEKPKKYATEIVKEYKNDPSSLPEDMEPFKLNWVPESTDDQGNVEVKGVSKVSQIHRAMRKGDLSTDKYSDPETFCELLVRLLERHREASGSETF